MEKPIICGDHTQASGPVIGEQGMVENECTKEIFLMKHPSAGISTHMEYDAPVTGGDSGWLAVWNGQRTYRQSCVTNDTVGVMHLQRLLSQIGYGPNNVGVISIDGILGAITTNAIRSFQKECQNLTADGVVGMATARMLENVQHDELFHAVEYAPLRAELMTYDTYPNYGNDYATQLSILCRCAFGEHGHLSQQTLGHHFARVGVAKVLHNRKYAKNIGRYNPNDYSWKSSYFITSEYSSQTNEFALTLPRGYGCFFDLLLAGENLWYDFWPSAAPLVTRQHLFQAGPSKNDPSKPGYCRYPETGSQYSWFHC